MRIRDAEVFTADHGVTIRVYAISRASYLDIEIDHNGGAVTTVTDVITHKTTPMDAAEVTEWFGLGESVVVWP